MCPVARCRRGPSPRSERLGTPKTPAIRSTRDPSFEASLVRICYGLSGCSPPWTDLTKFPWPTGGFYIQASDGLVALPAAGYDYNSNWTPLLAGLSPAGMAASLAAPDPDVQICRVAQPLLAFAPTDPIVRRYRNGLFRTDLRRMNHPCHACWRAGSGSGKAVRIDL